MGAVLGNDMIVRERVADRLREAEAERRSRPLSEFRAARRRGRVGAAFTAMRASVTPSRRRALPQVVGR